MGYLDVAGLKKNYPINVWNVQANILFLLHRSNLQKCAQNCKNILKPYNNNNNNNNNNITKTEIYGQVSAVAYSRHPGFKSRPWHRLHGFVVSLSSSLHVLVL